MTTREKIEVMEAFDRGEKIEYACNGRCDWRGCTAPSWNFFCYDYRIKPAPKKRLIRPEELPGVFWVRHKTHSKPSTWNLVIQIGEKCLITHHDVIYWEDLQSDAYAWSPDRVSVRSFWVEEI